VKIIKEIKWHQNVKVMTKIPQVRNGTVACTYANLDINYHGSF
jgi:hypothetical protein